MILLDTHAWIYYVNGDYSNIPSKTLKRLRSEDGLAVSSISYWEVAMLYRKGRMEISGMSVSEWALMASGYDNIETIDVTPGIGLEAEDLGGWWDDKDPADRIIAATAKIHGMILATADSTLHKCPVIQTIW